MNQVSEVTVRLKNDEATINQKFLCYDPLHDMKRILQYVAEAKSTYDGSVDEVIVTTKMVIE